VTAGAPQAVEAVRGRSFRPALEPAVLSRIQRGVMRTTYRGRRLYKCPFDLVLYEDLVGRLRPATILEIGTKDGGSAMWFADRQRAAGIAPCVVTVDLHAPEPLEDPGVRFVQGDALALRRALPADLLAGLPRPWLVVEDSAHLVEVCLAVLAFFDGHLRAGEYVVVEDGVLADLPEPVYREFEDGPNRAVKRFLEEQGDRYAIDAELCDRYGHNVTWAPNAWLRRR
jgi:cephalosporin hydroxylase